MTRIESTLARLCLIIISFIFTFVLIESLSNFYLWNIADEATFRFFATIDQVKSRYGQDFYTDGSELLYEPHHYIGYIPRINHRTDTNYHNALGFRGDEITIEKPDDIYRIVSVGASTTYGIGEPRPQNSYPSLLQDYLHANNYTNVEVINAGVGGYTSYESLLNLQMRVLPLEPDLIVIYQGSNDIHARFIWPPDAYLGDNSGYREPRVQDIVIPKIWEYSTVLRMIGIQLGLTLSQSDIDWGRNNWSPSSQYNLLNQQHRSGIYPSGIFTDISAVEMLDANPPINFERNLRNMVATSLANDVEVLLMTYVINPEFGEFKVSSDAYISATSEHNDITRAMSEQMGTFLIDLATTFPQSQEHFTDGRHFTRSGNLIIAEQVGTYIIDNIFETEAE